jgi:phosphate-selective porin
MRHSFILLTSIALAVCVGSVSAQTPAQAERKKPTAQKPAPEKPASPQKPTAKTPAPPQKPTAQRPAPQQPAPAAPQKPAPPQQPDEPEGFHVRKRPPSLRFGTTARIDFRLKMHGDHRSFSPDLRREERFDFRRLRAGVEGEVMNVVQYEFEYDFREHDYPLRDAFVDIRTSRALQIRGGKFKMPFSREALTGAMNLDFAFRSRAADQLSPGRAVGAMAHGRFFDRRMQYQVGWFREDGEHTRRNPLRFDSTLATPEDPVPDSSAFSAPTWAARATIRGGGDLSGLEVGAAMTTGEIREGRNSVRGRMVFGGGFFPAFEVNGRRQRLGLEAEYETARGSIAAEFMRVRDERLGQGFDNDDLEPLIGTGWYIAGTWLAAGRRPGGDADRPASRAGAIEVIARYEALRFGGPSGGDEPSRSPRAAVILPNADRTWTWGVNWYVNPLMRVQGNIIRERLDNAVRAPIPSQHVYWSSIVRFQFVL